MRGVGRVSGMGSVSIYGMRSSLSGLGAITFNTQPTSDWTCADWKFWHEELVKAFRNGSFASRIKYSAPDALRLANQVFQQWWGKMSGFFTKHQFCGYSSDFYRYFEKAGLGDTVLSYFQGIVTPVATGATQITQGAVNTASNAANAAANASKTLGWLIPVALVGVVAIGGLYLYNNYGKDKSEPVKS